MEALESSLYRIGTGKNRSYQLDKQGGVMLDWLNNAIGNIMFINTRSALLQTISSGNFVNWSDNNPLNAANTRSGKTRLKKIEDQIDEITDKVTERNQQISDTNQELVTTIKSEESTPTQIESAKNKFNSFTKLSTFHL